jgi:hypothetical protein
VDLVFVVFFSEFEPSSQLQVTLLIGTADGAKVSILRRLLALGGEGGGVHWDRPHPAVQECQTLF